MDCSTINFSVATSADSQLALYAKFSNFLERLHYLRYSKFWECSTKNKFLINDLDDSIRKLLAQYLIRLDNNDTTIHIYQSMLKLSKTEEFIMVYNEAQSFFTNSRKKYQRLNPIHPVIKDVMSRFELDNLIRRKKEYFARTLQEAHKMLYEDNGMCAFFTGTISNYEGISVNEYGYPHQEYTKAFKKRVEYAVMNRVSGSVRNFKREGKNIRDYVSYIGLYEKSPTGRLHYHALFFFKELPFTEMDFDPNSGKPGVSRISWRHTDLANLWTLGLSMWQPVRMSMDDSYAKRFFWQWPKDENNDDVMYQGLDRLARYITKYLAKSKGDKQWTSRITMPQSFGRLNYKKMVELLSQKEKELLLSLQSLKVQSKGLQLDRHRLQVMALQSIMTTWSLKDLQSFRLTILNNCQTMPNMYTLLPTVGRLMMKGQSVPTRLTSGLIDTRVMRNMVTSSVYFSLCDKISVVYSDKISELVNGTTVFDTQFRGWQHM